MAWYYADGGRQLGPVDDTAFQGLVTTGVIPPETLVWQAGMPSWQAYQTLRGPAPPPPPPAPPPIVAGAPIVGVAAPVAADLRFCSECGRQYPASEMVAFGNSLVCATCKPVFTQKMVQGVSIPGTQFGGFWIRFGAVVIDSVLLYIAGLIVFAISSIFIHIDWMNFGRTTPDIMQLLALEGILVGANLIIAACYETYFIGRYGATPGKMVCHLQVVMADGGKLSYGRSLGRHFAKFLSSFILAIGYIMAGIDDEKRALHDRICDTRVIKK